MAQGLELGLGVPLWIGYAVSTLIIFPLVVYGMTLLTKLQLWTTPLWLVLMVAPFVYLRDQPPRLGHRRSSPTRARTARGSRNLGSVFLAAGVCLSLIAQIAEQIDYLRFMPPKTPENSRRWWTARCCWPARAGSSSARSSRSSGCSWPSTSSPTWPTAPAVANQPVHQFLEIYRDIMPAPVAHDPRRVLVVISQIKINVTNAYSGSLAWTNSFTRVTKHYPGRLVFLGVNLLIALVLMEANMFDFLNTILGFYANCGMSWVVVVASDIAINKYLLKLSPAAAGVPPRHALRRQPGRLRLDAGLGRASPSSSSSAASGRAAAVLAAGRHRPGARAAAGAGAGHRGRYYLRRRPDDGIDLPMLDEHGNPSGRPATATSAGRTRAARHGRLPDPRRGGLLAVPEHRQGRRPRAARPARGAVADGAGRPGSADPGRPAVLRRPSARAPSAGPARWRC